MLKMNKLPDNKSVYWILLIALFFSCRQPDSFSIHQHLERVNFMEGKTSYLESSYVTAGDRVYIVGHQDGTFPDLGWHVTGEMGGVWDHPIKLLDGFRLAIGKSGQPALCLPPAEKFINYPFASKHIYPSIDGIAISSISFVPDGLEGVVIEYELNNTLSSDQHIVLDFGTYVDLRPVWLAERLNVTNGDDSGYWDQLQQHLLVKDSLNPWYVAISSSRPVKNVSTRSDCDYDRVGKGINYSLQQQIDIGAGEKKIIQYYIAGSYQDRMAAIQTLDILKDSLHVMVDQKQERYNRLQQTNRLKTDDPQLDQMFEWVRYNTDWLIREVPEQGRGLSAGLPDYPWWFGTDNGYAIEGMLAYGMFEEALATINLIFHLSEKENGLSGKIMHETSTNGVVFNPGNLNTTPRFIHTLWQTYQWIGADSLLPSYWPRVQRSIAWIEAQDHDANGYPDGPGMMEIPGLHTEMIDVVAYQAQAYEAAARFAVAVGEELLAKEYQEKYQLLKSKINSEWWSADFRSYADFRSTREQAIDLTKAAMVRADTINKPWSVDELKQTLQKIQSASKSGTQAYVVHHNWVVNTPLETGLADPDKAKIAMETADRYQNRFGMFVTGIDRDEQQEGATQWKSFSYVGAVMTLPTGVQAIGAARYGQINRAYDYLKKLNNSFSYALPGSMFEVSPDFGMVAQAWNAYAVAVPVVSYLAGIQPLAAEKTWQLAPQLPDSLSNLRLSDVRIGNNRVMVQLTRDQEELIAQIEQANPEWGVWIQPSENFSYDAERVTMTTQGMLLYGPHIRVSWRK